MRLYDKMGIVFFCCVAMLLLRGGAFAAVLAENGSTDYSIVLAPDVSPTDRFAAEELRTFLEQSTTARLAITNLPVAV